MIKTLLGQSLMSKRILTQSQCAPQQDTYSLQKQKMYVYFCNYYINGNNNNKEITVQWRNRADATSTK